jgi:NCS1 family nucleobase:cation symporter-1
VILAGWTTSNPTLYRAGLALQAVTPGWPRPVVTLLAGIATTLIACSPFVFQWLLQFVAIYGLLLMPMGTIVVVEHWIFPRIGLTQYWASRAGMRLNWPALVSWTVALALSLYLYASGLIHEFFLAIPVWIVTALLYIGLASAAGARRPRSASIEPAKTIDRPAALATGRPPSGPSQPTATEMVGAPATGRNMLLLWISGIVALLALVICLALPVWVFVMGTDGLEARLVTFKTSLLWASIVQLLASAVWIRQKEASLAID